MPVVREFADGDALARAAAEELLSLAAAAIAARGRFVVALSGGSTPKKMHAALVARGAGAVDWSKIEIWFGDERTVPPTDKDSNYRMARETLLDPLAIDPAHVHRIVGEGADFAAHEASAAAYERAMVAALGTPPVFDLVFLGMGPDGHTLSLFPGSPGVSATSGFMVANAVDSPVAGGKTTRITMTFATVAAARHARFLVAGADKAVRLAEILDGPPDVYPAQRIRGADVQWFVDAAANAGRSK
jgi:6-phosphogluconolactonase